MRADTCSATSSGLTFAGVSPISTASASSSGTVTVTCNWSAATLNRYALVCLNLGSGDGSNITNPRSMINGTNALTYNMYSGNGTIWGSTSTPSTPTPISTTQTTALSLGTQVTTGSVAFNGSIPGNQTNVPTVNNSTTTYTEGFSGGNTRLDYGFYLTPLVAPTCQTLAAGSGGFPFTVTASVINSCNITATPLNFGSTSSLATQRVANSAVSVQCTNGDAYRIALDGGTSSSNVARRTMKGASSAATVSYQLYTTDSRSVIWGDGTAGTSVVSSVGSGLTAVVPVYGLVPVQSTPIPDTYTDTVTATVTF